MLVNNDDMCRCQGDHRRYVKDACKHTRQHEGTMMHELHVRRCEQNGRGRRDARSGARLHCNCHVRQHGIHVRQSISALGGAGECRAEIRTGHR